MAIMKRKVSESDLFSADDAPPPASTQAGEIGIVNGHATTCAHPNQCNGRCAWTIPDLRNVKFVLTKGGRWIKVPRVAPTPVEAAWSEMVATTSDPLK